MAQNQNIPARQSGKASNPGPEQVRVGGSGFSLFYFENKPIGFAQRTVHVSPQPVAAPVPIQPLDARYPIDIITPAAIGPGTLQVYLFERYNSKIWDSFMQILDANHRSGVNTNRQTFYNDLAEVFIRFANIGRGITCQRLVLPPNKVQAVKRQFYADVFHNLKLTDIRDDETIEIGTMPITKYMTFQYTHMSRNHSNS